MDEPSLDEPSLDEASPDEPGSSRPTIVELVGVYNADGTIRGELGYWVGKRLGRAHCALCDITHGSVRERPDWQRCRDGLPVPFTTFHRNDQPAAVRTVVAGSLPAIVAMTASEPVLLLGPDELGACEGSPERLARAVIDAADRLALAWG